MKVLLLLGLLLSMSFGKVFFDQWSIIEEINKVQTTWKSGYNHYFDGKSLEEIKYLMGSLKVPEHLKLPEKQIQPLKDIPTQFNPIDKWPGCDSLKEIRDQSTCGSCWAFGAVEAMSDRICIASGQKLQTRVSAEDVLACCRSCGNGCNGGYPSAAWSYYKSQGIVTGDLYNDTKWCSAYAFAPCDHHTTGKYGPCGSSKPTPKCSKQCAAGYPKTWSQDKLYASDVYRVPSTMSKMQTQLMTNGPIEVSFTVYSDFLTYKSGVYQHQSGGVLGGHAVKMVGWGVDNGTPYWLVANSWNEGWGDNGYFKIIRGKNECGIEGDGVAGTPKLQSTQLLTE